MREELVGTKSSAHITLILGLRGGPQKRTVIAKDRELTLVPWSHKARQLRGICHLGRQIWMQGKCYRARIRGRDLCSTQSTLWYCQSRSRAHVVITTRAATGRIRVIIKRDHHVVAIRSATQKYTNQSF